MPQLIHLQHCFVNPRNSEGSGRFASGLAHLGTRIRNRSRGRNLDLAHVALVTDDVVLQQTERVRRHPREYIISEHRRRHKPRRFFAQPRRERFAGRVERAARVRVLTLQEERHQRRRAAAQRVTHDDQPRRRRDLSWKRGNVETLSRRSDGRSTWSWRRGRRWKIAGRMFIRSTSLRTSLATKYIPCE